MSRLDILSSSRIRAKMPLVVISFLLAGCTVGPKYHTPSVQTPAAYKELTPADFKNTDGWKVAEPQDDALKGKWWEIFKEPELNTLEEQLDINNQNIAQYFQNFMAARAQIRESKAGYYPTLTVQPSFNRTRSGQGGAGGYVQTGTTTTTAGSAGTTGTTGTTGNTGGAGTSAVSQSNGNVTFNDLALPFDVAWEPDLWGRVRNTVREYQYAAQVSATDLENERLTEQADLAEYYFELRGQDALQDLTTAPSRPIEKRWS